MSEHNMNFVACSNSSEPASDSSSNYGASNDELDEFSLKSMKDAKIFLKEGRYDEAVYSFRNVVNKYGNYSVGHYYLGEAL